MKKKLFKSTVFLLIFPFIISGCATIVSRSAYPVAIRTNPKGANISITDKSGKVVYTGTGPATVMLRSGAGYFSKAQYEVKIGAPGYNDEITTLYSRINGWYFGNLLLGGLIGMLIVDPATGAMWKLDAPPIDVTLSKSIALLTIPTLKIINMGDVPENLRASLVKIR